MQLHTYILPTFSSASPELSKSEVLDRSLDWGIFKFDESGYKYCKVHSYLQKLFIYIILYVYTLKRFAEGESLKSVEVFRQDLPEWHCAEQIFPSFLQGHCLVVHPFLHLQIAVAALRKFIFCAASRKLIVIVLPISGNCNNPLYISNSLLG